MYNWIHRIIFDFHVNVKICVFGILKPTQMMKTVYYFLKKFHFSILDV